MTFRHKLAGSAALIALTQGLVSIPAIAQTAPAVNQATAPAGADVAATGSKGAENIVVTGSRLRTTNSTSESPVTIVTSAQIEHSSAQTVEDVLQRLPSIGTSGLYGTTNNGGEGASCTDLRNLGINRVLVLVDGRRFVHTGIFGADCVDLNNIPLSLIESIEILKDGASSTYGADAVSGVINLKLKHNFTGTVIKADGSIGTDVGDSRQGDLSATTGFNFDKGNVVISTEYENRGPELQRDHAFANFPQQTNTNPPLLGSGIPPGTRIFSDGNSTGTFQGSGFVATPGGPVQPFTRANRFNLAQEAYLTGALEKESFTGLANYDFTPGIQGYMQTYFTHKKTTTQLNPQPITGGLTSVVPDAFVVPEGNPYLTSLLGAGSGPVDLYHRAFEIGDRTNINSTNTFQFNGGFKGTLGFGWDYDTFFTYGQSDSTIRSTGEVNFQHLEQEVGFQQQPATANTADPTTFGIYNPGVCVASTGCVLINPFGAGAISKAGAAYAGFTETATSSFTLRAEGGSITNNDVFDLPYGPVGLSFGAENRRESGQYNPDNLVGTGVTLENAQSPTQGAFNVTEVFGEAKLQLLKDLPAAKDLSVDLGGRFFHYNTFGSGEIWKVSGNWTPFTGLRFRGSTGTAFRQPSVQELFGGQSLGFNGATDPCATSSQSNYSAAQRAIVTANCAKQGINTGNFSQLGNTQVQTIQGGNPALNPETARTQTLGAVITPSFIPRSALTVDYFRYKIQNSVGVVDTQTILDQCYTSSNLSSPFCGNINPRVAQQQLGTVSAINQNLGVTKEDGIDIGANYSIPTPYGKLSFENDAVETFQYLTQNQPNGPFINLNGKIYTAANIATGFPRFRDNFSTDFAFGDFSVGYRMRYIGPQLYYPTLAPPFNQYNHYKTDEVFYHDITASYSYANISATIGIDNLFDKTPPFVLDGATNTDPSVYDVLGRVLYVKTTFRF